LRAYFVKQVAAVNFMKGHGLEEPRLVDLVLMVASNHFTNARALVLVNRPDG
jgi:hypothetical protein